MGMIRLLLALSVVVLHTATWYEPQRPPAVPVIDGNVAVELFFVISGFYMGLVLSEKYTPAAGPGWWRTFYAARFMRLYPAFLVVTLATVPLMAVVRLRLSRGGLADLFLGLLPPSDPFGPLGRGLLTLSNLTMIGQDLPSFFYGLDDGSVVIQLTLPEPTAVRAADGLLIGPAWSIGVEIWFYLLAPWLVRRPAALLWAAMAASLGVKLYLVHSVGWSGNRFFPAELWLFLAGVLAYRHRLAVPRWVGWPALLGFLVAFSTWDLWAPGWGEGTVLAVFPLALPAVFALSARWKWDRAVGELSYPVYLSHGLILTVIAAFGRRFGVGLPQTWLVVSATLAASVVIHVLVERPVERYRQRFSTPPMRPTPPLAPE